MSDIFNSDQSIYSDNTIEESGGLMDSYSNSEEHSFDNPEPSLFDSYNAEPDSSDDSHILDMDNVSTLADTSIIDPDQESLTKSYGRMNGAIRTHLRNDLARTDSQSLDVNMLDTLFEDDGSPIDEIIGRRLDPINKAKIQWQLNSNMDIVNQLYMDSRTGYRFGNADGNDFKNKGFANDEHWQDVSGVDSGDWTSSGEVWTEEGADWTKDSSGLFSMNEGERNEGESSEEILGSNGNSTAATSNETSISSAFYQVNDKKKDDKKEISFVDNLEQDEKDSNWQEQEGWIETEASKASEIKGSSSNKKDDSSFDQESVAFAFAKKVEQDRIRLETKSIAEEFNKEMDARKIRLDTTSIAEEFSKIIDKRKKPKKKDKDDVGLELAQGGLAEITTRQKVQKETEGDTDENQSSQEKHVLKKITESPSDHKKLKEALNLKSTNQLLATKSNYEEMRKKETSHDKIAKIDTVIMVINSLLQ